MPQMDIRLADAGCIIAEEIYDNRWNHIKDISRRPATQCRELLDELRSRCPGYSESEYQEALAYGLFAMR